MNILSSTCNRGEDSVPKSVKVYCELVHIDREHLEGLGERGGMYAVGSYQAPVDRLGSTGLELNNLAICSAHFEFHNNTNKNSQQITNGTKAVGEGLTWIVDEKCSLRVVPVSQGRARPILAWRRGRRE